MSYSPKRTIKPKSESVNRTLYISVDLLKRVEKVSEETGFSPNAIMVSMIEYCLDDMEEEKQ